jgi:prepilin-type N-terminal cleavage/methylation domain-containing protein
MRIDVNSSRQRPGFTLVEMIVVMSIVGILFALTVALSPRVTSSSRITSGTSTVQTSLFTAKSMALRDQFPRGVRLVRESNSPFLDPPTNQVPNPNYNIVKTLQYLEQPAPYVNGVLVSVDANLVATFQGADFSSGAVLPGDYLDVFDTGAKSLSLITNIVSATTLQLASAPSANLSFPRTYRILRGPRPMIGEKQVDLPRDIVIDVSQSVMLPDQTTGQLDILLSPTGQVTRSNQTLGKVMLWVRDANVTKVTGEQYLVVINTKTGLVGTYPVDITVGGDPYSYTKSGRGSGM